MSNGYLIANEADLAAAHEIGEGFGLDVIDAGTIGDHAATASALATAANVGLMISSAAVANNAFVALLRSLSLRLQTAQLIFVDAAVRAELAFLPQKWPAMSLDEARARAARRLQANRPHGAEETRAAPMPPAATTPAPVELEIEPPPFDDADDAAEGPASEAANDAQAPLEDALSESPANDADIEQVLETESAPEPEAPPQHEATVRTEPPGGERHIEAGESFGGSPSAAVPSPQQAEEASPPPLAMPAPAPAAPAPQAPPKQAAPATHAKRNAAPESAAASSAPADATAFAPKKLRRGTPELVRIVIHQPKQLKDVIKAARKIDPRTAPAPQGMSIGEVALGAQVGVSLDVRGASGDGALQKRAWAGEPIDFSFSVEADDDVKQAVFLARVFVNDAQIGVIAFTRGVTGATKAAAPGDARLKRHKRVFLSYSSADRETVSVIATAYQMAGVEHFWDRASLKSGEEWSPRLRKEIDRADLFHLCWSKAAAKSEWVEKETEHALERRKKNRKTPDITVQMLDGPPWAPHPPHLDAINFDDFVRAAIVGYARGDGGE